MPFFGVPIRNGLPIGLGSVAGFGVQQFDPSQLFEGGTVAGAWYDPSDLSTMFDTSTGATPVAMPGQGAAVPVGLMLDKSQGLVLGSELVTNGDFSNGTTGWTANSADANLPTLSVSSGILTVTNNATPGGFGRATQAITTVSGKWYLVVLSLNSNGLLTASNNSNGSAAFAVSGANGKTLYFLASAATTYVSLVVNSAFGGASSTFDNISVRELPGNHAISFNNTTARPELRARVNLLTYSEEFDNGVWNFAFQRTSIVTPGVPYYKLAEAAPAAGSVVHRVSNGIPSINNVDYVFSVVAKADTRKRVLLYHFLRGAWFDLVTGQCGADTTYPTSVVPTMVAQNDGSYICTMKFTAALTGTDGIQIYIGTDTQTTITATRIGDGTSGVLCKSADLRPANIGANVPAYQRIVDANTYDTSGFPLYLRFDGIDDSMYTPANLNLSGTDKVAVFAGVRQTTAGNQQLVEFSVDVNANNGAFSMPKDAVAAATWTIGLRGTSATSASSPASYAAPITTVNAGLYDIALSTDEAKLRINGAQVATSGAGSAGTGNFGTYPLYIGARNNSSVWFNGHLYSLAVVGSAVSAGNIAAMESWVAGRTGIQI